MNVVTSNDASSTIKFREITTLLAYTRNVCRRKQIDKMEVLVQFSVEKCIDFTCIQETWLEGRYCIDIETMGIDSKETVSCTFFHYGQEKQINRGLGRVGILLSKRGRDTWERAGLSNPIYAPTVNSVA